MTWNIFEAPYDRWLRLVEEARLKRLNCEHKWEQNHERFDSCINCGAIRETEFGNV